MIRNVPPRATGNLHAFCNSCSLDDGSLSPYCAAAVRFYNSFDMDGLVLVHAESFWCRHDVLASIEEGVEVFTRRFGKHVDWWDDDVTDDELYKTRHHER